MIIEKDNNKINTYHNTRESFVSDDIYSIKTFNFLNVDNKYNRSTIIRKKFYNIFSNNIFSLDSNNNYKDFVINIYKKLIKITNKNDLVSLYNDTKKELLAANQIMINNNYKDIDKAYKKAEDIVLNEFVHKIINKYFYYFIREYDRKNTTEIVQLVMTDNDFDILDCYDENIPKKRTNNIREIAEMELILAVYQVNKSSSHRHLCFDCPVNLCDCPKIMDDKKKSIEYYDFIKSGMQRYNDKTGELENFYVTDCELLNKTKKKTK